MKRPKITVLMPVYNAEKFLKEAIDSILNQTFKDFEFLIINDASTDNSKKIILSYKDPRIRYFENKKNLGVAGTLNKGLKLARAELIARMDADDISFPNRFELQYKEMQKDKEIAVLVSNYDVVNENGKFLRTQRYAKSPEEIYYTLQFRNCLGHPTTMFRKYITLDIFNGFDKRHEAEDYDLWLRVSKKYKLTNVNCCLLKLRVSEKSRMTSFLSKKINRDAIFIAKKNLESLTGEKINLDIIKILVEHFAIFRYNISTEFPDEKIKKAIIILEKVNNEILTHHTAFLNRSVLEKIITKKYNLLRHDLYLSTLFNLRFGFILKFLCRSYFFFKRRFVLKFCQLGHFLTSNII